MNDDLRLALALADAADEITMRHFQSATLAVRTKSDRTPVSEADEAVERMIRERLGARAAGRRHRRRGVRRTRHAARRLDHRSDRRHEELRARHSGLRDADRARRISRRRLRAGDAAALVGVARRRRVLQWDGDPRLDRSRRSKTRTLLRRRSRLRAASDSAAVSRSRAPLRPHPRLRRLLVAHARRRGAARSRSSRRSRIGTWRRCR